MDEMSVKLIMKVKTETTGVGLYTATHLPWQQTLLLRIVVS